MPKYSLSKTIVGAKWLQEGVIANTDGSISRAFTMNPLPAGNLEEEFDGPIAEQFFNKLSELLTRLPNQFDGHFLFQRRLEAGGLFTKITFLEKVAKAESYSHLHALVRELNGNIIPLGVLGWKELLSGFLGGSLLEGVLPDVTWERDCIRAGNFVSRILSLTELPQLSWIGCLQPIFEFPGEFTLSLRIHVPDRAKIKRQLETKRRVSHAMSIASSLEVRNIESNSVLGSSEETLERILVEKETLFEVSVALVLHGTQEGTLATAREFERIISGVGNAGLFSEGVGALPVIQSHIPGNKILGIRKLPILSGNLGHIMPLFLDYSRNNDSSSLSLRSRSGEVSALNLFSRENLNYNSFLCGASGSGKSFLMNAILSANLEDEKGARLCIFDIGGSYRKIVAANGGKSTVLTAQEARALLASFLRVAPVSPGGFYRTFLETLCGSGSHISHSHRVAIEELLKELEGQPLKIRELIHSASKKPEKFFQDIAHWLKPHSGIDEVEFRSDLVELIQTQVSAFDFKELESDPILQKTTILLLTELLWRDLTLGKYPRTLIVFDEVWRFFAQSKDFLEEMYRTLRKYRAGVVSITQNLADYGDEAFAKMLFTNSFTKIFLQSGASAEFLRNTFDLPESDISRALSVASKKPLYSEFFALTPRMSQVFRLYPTKEFYDLANTENITQQ